MQPVRLLALIITLWMQALLAHLHGNVLHRSGQHFVELLQVHYTVIGQYIRLAEYAMHVALQILVRLVGDSVAKLLDGLCGSGVCGGKRTDVLIRELERVTCEPPGLVLERTLGHSSLGHTSVVQGLQRLQQDRRGILRIQGNTEINLIFTENFPVYLFVPSGSDIGDGKGQADQRQTSEKNLHRTGCTASIAYWTGNENLQLSDLFYKHRRLRLICGKSKAYYFNCYPFTTYRCQCG